MSLDLGLIHVYRVAAFRKGLIQYAQCQIRQSRECYALMRQTLLALKELQATA